MHNPDYYDWLEEREADRQDRIDQMIDDGIWTTSDGDEINISDMETVHLENTITYLKGSSFYRASDYIDLMQSELDHRDEKMFE